jgi:acyl carrier protein
MASVEDVVRAFIVEELLHGDPPDELSGSTYLIEENIIDSLGIFETVAFLEQRFSVTIEAEEVTIDNFETLDAICRLVDSKVDHERSDSA